MSPQLPGCYEVKIEELRGEDLRGRAAAVIQGYINSAWNFDGAVALPSGELWLIFHIWAYLVQGKVERKVGA